MPSSWRHGAALMAVGLLVVLLPGVSPAAAMDPGPTAIDDRPDRSVSVSPSRVIVPAGTRTHTVDLTVTNRGQQALDVVAQQRHMSANDDGTIGLPRRAAYSAAELISIDQHEFHLEANQDQQVRLEVAVPDGYEPGDHYAAVVFRLPSRTDGSGMQVSTGVGVPVYVQAPGPVDRSVELTDFEGPRFAMAGPVTFTATLRHTGTVRREFYGDDRLIMDAAGSTVAMPEFTVLRDATRQVSTEWADPPLMCICETTLAFPMPDGGVEHRSVTVVVFPLHITAGVIGSVLAAVLLSYVIRRRARTAPAGGPQS